MCIINLVFTRIALIICAYEKKTFYVILLFLCTNGLFPHTGWAINVVNPPVDNSSVETVASVSGTVTNEAGEPVAGATIRVKGTNRGVITNDEGKFILDVSGNVTTLIISYIGYETREVKIASRSVIDITLTVANYSLDEVVVVGYGIQKKVNLTGAVSTIRGDALKNRPITSVGHGLQGLIPNLNITIRNGDPTEAANFNIRGFESINGGEPLILVDGVPMALERINPNDIASVNVIKDASASAVYGARAAFGVILVETKSGKKGKPRISFSTEQSLARPILHMDIMDDPYEYVKLENQANIRATGLPLYDDKYVAAVKAWTEGTGPEWGVVGGELQYYGYNNYQDEIITNFAPQRKYDLSISGATDNASYYVSLGHLSKDGYWNHASNERFKRYNVLVKAEFKVNDWLSLEEKIVYNGQANDKPTGYSWIPLTVIRPTQAIQFPDLEYYLTPGDKDQYAQYSGMYFGAFNNNSYLQDGGRTTFHLNDTWLTQGVTLKPLRGLVVKANFSYNTYHRDDQIIWSEVAYIGNTDLTNLQIDCGFSCDDYVENRTDFDKYYALNAYAEFTPQTGADHFLKGMVGVNQEWGRYTFQRVKARELITPLIGDLNATTGRQETYGGKQHVALRGVFYRFNYRFKNKYLFEANGRYDGTSRFPKEDRYGFFPSFSAGWRVSEEPFMTGLRVVNNLKIRASYGTLGNQLLGENYYPYIPAMGLSQSPYMFSAGNRSPFITPPGLVKSTLTWETVVSKNLGVDFSLLDQRMEGSFDIYTRDTRNMLMRVDFPSVLGTEGPNQNAADLRTRGWEATLTWLDRGGEDWKYSLTFSLADWLSEVTRYENPTGALSEYYVGQQIGEIWGYETVGIFQTEEEVGAAADQSFISRTGWQPGDIRYADLNKDGKIDRGINTLDDHGDLTIIGNGSPRYTFGINLDLFYKHFSLSSFFQGVGKRDYWPNELDGTWFFPFNARYAEWYYLTDTWREDNRDAYFPAVNNNVRDNKNTQWQTRFVQDASYIRLKNLTLSYDVPASFLTKIGLSEGQIYVAGMNLWEASRIRKPLDPEYLRRNVLAPQFNNPGGMLYPLQRIYALGVRVSF